MDHERSGIIVIVVMDRLCLHLSYRLYVGTVWHAIPYFTYSVQLLTAAYTTP